jgi:hypothetical protein
VASLRSIVAAEITAAAAVLSLISSSPNRRSVTTSMGSAGANRLRVGAPSIAQHNRSAHADLRIARSCDLPLAVLPFRASYINVKRCSHIRNLQSGGSK